MLRLTALLLLISCADAGSSVPAGSTIGGTIRYEGAAREGGRPLAIAVYATLPPSGPPVAWRVIEQYELPYRYVFEGLPPGRYVVGASIDVDPADTRYLGRLNPGRDPHGYSGGGQPFDVDDYAGADGADIRLEDPR